MYNRSILFQYLGGIFKLLDGFKMVELGKATDLPMAYIGDTSASKIQLFIYTEKGKEIDLKQLAEFQPGAPIRIKRAYAKIRATGFLTFNVYEQSDICGLGDGEHRPTFVEDSDEYDVVLLPG